SSQLLRHAHDRTARARIDLELGSRGILRFAEQLEARIELRHLYRQVARQVVGLALHLATHELLDDAILQRMETDHHQTAAHGERLQRRLETALEIAQLVVDMDAQALE